MVWLGLTLLMVAGAGPEAEPQQAEPLPPPVVAPAPEAGPVAPPTVAPPPLAPAWKDAPDATLTAGVGGMDICMGVTLPLQAVPQLGRVVAAALEWLCLPPTALHMDQVERMHGSRQGHVWQALVALALAKVWRDAVDLPVLFNSVAAGLGVVGSVAAAVVVGIWAAWLLWVQDVPGSRRVAPALTVAAVLVPWAATSLITWTALWYQLASVVKGPVSSFILTRTYRLLTGTWPTPAVQSAAQQTHRIRPPYNVAERSWLEVATALGTSAPFHWTHLLPAVGPLLRSFERWVAVKHALRRVAADDLGRAGGNWDRLDYALACIFFLEGFLGAVSHVGLVVNGFVLAVGALALAAQVVPQLQFISALPLLTAMGGMVAAGSAVVLVFLVLRDLPQVLLPWVIPPLLPDGAEAPPPSIPPEPSTQGEPVVP